MRPACCVAALGARPVLQRAVGKSGKWLQRPPKGLQKFRTRAGTAHVGLVRVLQIGRRGALSASAWHAGSGFVVLEWHMRKSTGVALLFVGLLGCGGYLLPAGTVGQLSEALTVSPANGQQAPAAPPAASGEPADRAQGRTPGNQPRVFSPSAPLIATPPAQSATGSAAGTAKGQNGPAVVAPNTVRVPDNTPRSAGSAPFAAPFDGENPRRLATSKPADDDAKRELALDLQKELTRVGCYDGEINGTWSAASKKAMAAFTERVNATLPVEEPDYILLTLVQGHAALACGKSCPPGQGLSGDGRCQPRAILAQSARKSDRKPGEEKAVAKAAPDGAKDAPKADAAAKAAETAKAAEPKSGPWTTTTTTASADTPKPAAPQVPLAEILLNPPAGPLPGRMAMGAPIPSGSAAQAAAQADAAERARLDELDRKRKAQAALADEQKSRAEALAEAERLRAERLRQEAERRERQVAAADARRLAQKQAEALEAETRASDSESAAAAAKANAVRSNSSNGSAADKALAAAAAIAAQDAADERRAAARRAAQVATDQQRAREQRDNARETQRADAERARAQERQRQQAERIQAERAQARADERREQQRAAARAEQQRAASVVVRRPPPSERAAPVYRPAPRPSYQANGQSAQRWQKTIFEAR
jgi:hypothetical protein